MFGQCPIFVYLGLMLCEQAKIGKDGVLAEYLRFLGGSLGLQGFDKAYHIPHSGFHSCECGPGHNAVANAEFIYDIKSFKRFDGIVAQSVTGIDLQF